MCVCVCVCVYVCVRAWVGGWVGACVRACVRARVCDDLELRYYLEYFFLVVFLCMGSNDKFNLPAGINKIYCYQTGYTKHYTVGVMHLSHHTIAGTWWYAWSECAGASRGGSGRWLACWRCGSPPCWLSSPSSSWPSWTCASSAMPPRSRSPGWPGCARRCSPTERGGCTPSASTPASTCCPCAWWGTRTGPSSGGCGVLVLAMAESLGGGSTVGQCLLARAPGRGGSAATTTTTATTTPSPGRFSP